MSLFPLIFASYTANPEYKAVQSGIWHRPIHRGAGSSIGAQSRKVPDGGRVRVLVAVRSRGEFGTLTIYQIPATKYHDVYQRIYVRNVMKLQLAKWGNSLAVRLPAECVRAAGLRPGDSVEAQITTAGNIMLTPAKTFDKAAFLQRMRKLRQGMRASEPVVEQMRQDARY